MPESIDYERLKYFETTSLLLTSTISERPLRPRRSARNLALYVEGQLIFIGKIHLKSRDFLHPNQSFH